ncbi:MAG: arylsulfatase [Planctomycetota bacterium]|jgi:arylsulfatase
MQRKCVLSIMATAVICLFTGMAVAQEILPFPEPPSASVAGRTLQESKHQWRAEPQRLPENAPNIVIFMTDDAGFSNPECFGGPVHMPTMDKLAREGIAYNAFHTTAMCSPTRAALLTGRNHHRVGYGTIAELAADWDGYAGAIPRSAATMAQVLGSYGYASAALGKWHNTPIDTLTPSAPKDQWPTGLGFNYFYGFIAGETSQYEPRVFENTNPVEPPHDTEYHFTADMADHAIDFMREHRALNPERPFLLYFTPGAVHGPFHVQKEWADKYKGKFDAGWDKLREETFQRQKALGWIPEDAELTPIDPTMEKWEDIPESHREFQTRLMEVFAGFLEHTDVQYGRIITELENLGIRDNTLVIYIHSDNGASAEGMMGSISELLAQNGMVSTIDEHIEVLERDYGGMDALGGPLLDPMYHHGWAWAGDSPFKSTKLVAGHFGGTRTPLVISWPKRIKPDKMPRDQFHHVNDIVPTIYEILGITPPRTFNGVEQMPFDGVSMVYTFEDAQAKGRKTTQYFDIVTSRGIFHDGWFAAVPGPRKPWVPGLQGLPGWNPDNDTWELYNLAEDYSQANDLADKMPGKLRQMQDVFTMEATSNKVFPIGGGIYIPVVAPQEMKASTLTEWTFFEGHTRIPESMAPKFASGFSTHAVIEAELPDKASGVLYCCGGISAGFTAYMDEGFLKAEYNAMTLNRYKIASDAPLPKGKATIEVDVNFDSPQREGPATVTFTVNGRQVGQDRIGRSVPATFTASETFDVGMDLGSPVALDYHERAPFAFNGRIDRVHIQYTAQQGGGIKRTPDDD